MPSDIALPVALIRVPFLGATIYVSDEVEPRVPLRPICERLGLVWSAQAMKLRSAKTRWGVSMIDTPSEGGIQAGIAIPLRRLFAWLHSITAAKVKPAIRPTLERYQAECDRVLEQHFMRHRMGLPPAPAPGAEPQGDMLVAIYGAPKAAGDPEAERLAAKVLAARKAGAPFRKAEGEALTALGRLGYAKWEITSLIGMVAAQQKKLAAARQAALPLAEG